MKAKKKVKKKQGKKTWKKAKKQVGGGRPRLLDAKEVVKLYRKGKSIDAIADRFDVHPITVRNAFKVEKFNWRDAR